MYNKLVASYTPKKNNQIDHCRQINSRHVASRSRRGVLGWEHADRKHMGEIWNISTILEKLLRS